VTAPSIQTLDLAALFDAPFAKRRIASSDVLDELADGKSHADVRIATGDFHVDDTVAVDFDSDGLIAERNANVHSRLLNTPIRAADFAINSITSKALILSGNGTQSLRLPPKISRVGRAGGLPPMSSARPSLKTSSAIMDASLSATDADNLRRLS
jgi:hypothetical protein